MNKPDIPYNETERLEILRSIDILDTQAEERFDRVTRMAKRMFGVPIALVSIVDQNRQWFKSVVGLNATETPREISFCGHAILDSDVFIVPNAIEDPRFEDNPLVLEDPSIRFYAGCPLVVNGYRLGTLCLIDQTPRDFEADDVEALKDLASTVECELSAVQLATLDPLTGISNRRGFLPLAQNNLSLSLRNKFPVALVYLDLDKFKFINDNFGHAEGDSVLVSLATLFKDSFRESDIYARLGGDEFVILLNGTSKVQAELIMEKLLHSFKEHNQERARDYKVSFSYGVVEFDNKRHATIEGLLSDGDELMYELKKSKVSL